ncbi:uncharacterized protein SPAPADRAFT_58835 [Spathaspora passalidarum NRRL Y-27907]|uniref:Mrp8p n=1 Tax=Spathaspora passalidarum (strain NRRL Y-27907 / 11-Y1) TaxID=619300 RepID=G3AE87_SPAPN|nr:uncharacterized protein SPAPADRAFT_58835 [Spathaspora passalidarum NRRL Y-27907]EGW35621.1 hypothetical protein SPAPADRAFT_58835 [Spathaspora passalidarum NRRL Y-27907]
MPELTLEQLNEQVAKLSGLVERQSKIIAETGEQVLQLQVKDVKTRMSALDMKPQQPEIDLTDYINNEDIVQLVTELQTQLDNLEDRTIRRCSNASITKPSDFLAPLTNRDGDLPDFELPNTLQEFQNLDKVDIIRLAVFYEIIIPNQGSELEQQPEGVVPGISHAPAAGATAVENNSVDIIELSKQFDEIQAIEIFDELARYLGIKYRKGSNKW